MAKAGTRLAGNGGEGGQRRKRAQRGEKGGQGSGVTVVEGGCVGGAAASLHRHSHRSDLEPCQERVRSDGPNEYMLGTPRKRDPKK